MAMPLDILIDRYKRVILKHHQAETMLSPDGTKLDVDTEDPLYVWDQYKQADAEGKLVYYPQQFDKTNHQGKTKKELIAQNGAWEVRFIEDLPNLPAQGKGQTLGNRKQLEANQTPIQYLETIQTNQHEQGATPELWLTKAITYLEQSNQQIDDYQGPGQSSYLTGAYFPSSGIVPDASWYRGYQQAGLRGGNPGDRISSYAAFAAGENLLKS
jgi:hypothetical protein